MPEDSTRCFTVSNLRSLKQIVKRVLLKIKRENERSILSKYNLRVDNCGKWVVYARLFGVGQGEIACTDASISATSFGVERRRKIGMPFSWL